MESASSYVESDCNSYASSTFIKYVKEDYSGATVTFYGVCATDKIYKCSDNSKPLNIGNNYYCKK